MRRSLLALGLGLALALAACSTSEPAPGKAEFDVASAKIASSSRGAAAQGNTPAAQARAEAVAASMTALDRQLFTGQDEDRTVTLAEEFMVYAHHGREGVAFLINVPQFKRYKDDVRRTLVDAAWAAAKAATVDLQEQGPVELGVGLRGNLVFGAVAVGDSRGAPSVEIGAALEPASLYPLFVGAPPASAEVMPGASKAEGAAEAPGEAEAQERAPEERAPPKLEVEVLSFPDLAASLVERGIRDHDEGLQTCAEGLDEGARFDFLLSLKGDGKVKSVKPAAGHEPPEALRACLSEQAKAWVFPKKELKLTKPETGRVRFSFAADAGGSPS
ncbi:MAG: hypothetical protein KC486_23410 [Myxococcales bacterium]|nr:hypothetical protein [Myxococcales bacterium]